MNTYHQPIVSRTRRVVPALLCIIGWMLCANAQARPSPASDHDMSARIAAATVPFVANHGQLDARVSFYAHTFAGAVFVTRDGALVLSLPEKRVANGQGVRHARGWSLVEVPEHASRLAPRGLAASATGVSIFEGRKRSLWKAHLSTYRSVRMGRPWPGVTYDVIAHGDNVERVFTVAAGARADRISMRLKGASSLRLEHGLLVAQTGNGAVSLSRPVAYQRVDGKRHPVQVAYAVDGESYGFRLGHHDRSLPVIIDPVVAATYLGGSYNDSASAIRIASNGDVYIGGSTSSADFPGTSGGAQPALAFGATNAFVAILSPDLGSVIQSTYLGGSQLEGDISIELGTDGRVYVVGNTDSTDFPDATGCGYPGGKGIFAAELDATLTHLVTAHCFGGSAYDTVRAVAIDASNDLYVGGDTTSTDFPVTPGAVQPTMASSGDGFVMELSPDLSSITHATYLGSSSGGTVYALLAPGGGALYVGGTSTNSGFPGPTTGASGGGYVALLQPDLSAVTQSNFTGAYSPRSLAMAMASAGDIYASGKYQDSVGGTFYDDAYVERLTADLLTSEETVAIGGSGTDDPGGLAVAPDGTVFVSGTTTSTDFPGVAGGQQSSNAGGKDGFVAHYSADLKTLLQATYLGGSDSDTVADLAVAGDGTLYVAGTTTSTDFPVTAAAQGVNGGTFDAFIARYRDGLGLPPAPVITGLKDAEITYESGVDEALDVQGSGPLTVTGTSSNQTLIPDANILNVSSCTSAGSCDITVNAAKGQSGQAVITLTVSDRYGQSSTASFKITVDPLKKPSVSGLSDATVQLGQTVSQDFSVDGTGALTVTVTSSDTGVLPKDQLLSGGHCDTTSHPYACTLKLAPDKSTGSTTITYTVTDNYGQSVKSSFVLTVESAVASTSGSSGGGGGGAFGVWDLIALSLLTMALARRRHERD